MHISSVNLGHFLSRIIPGKIRSVSKELNIARNTCAAIKNPSPRTIESSVNFDIQEPIKFYKALKIISVDKKPYIDCVYMSHFRKTLEPAIIIHGTKEGRFEDNGTTKDAAFFMNRLVKENPLVKSNLETARRSPDKNKLHVVACSAGAAHSSADKIANDLEMTAVSYGKGIVSCLSGKHMFMKSHFFNNVFGGKIYWPIPKTPKIHEPSS